MVKKKTVVRHEIYISGDELVEIIRREYPDIPNITELNVEWDEKENFFNITLFWSEPP